MDLEFAISRLRSIADELQNIKDDMANTYSLNGWEPVQMCLGMAVSATRSAIDSAVELRRVEEEKELGIPQPGEASSWV